MRTLENNKLKIADVSNLEELAQMALDIFLDSAKSAVSQRGTFNVAISGGKTPCRFYELLADSERSRNLPWNKIHLFWVDERCVSPDSAESNYKLAADTFLPTVPVPPENIHRIAGEKANYNIAVQQYEEVIRKVFNLKAKQIPVFDLMLLGMGPDGHIGSLLPNSYALFDTDDIVSVVYQLNGGLNRITLTHPVMCAAEQIIVMISGGEKAEIIRDVLLEAPDEVKYPVHSLWPILDKVLWIIDSDAAKYL